MSSKILQVLAVIVEGLFSGKCDSCRNWRSCAAERSEGKTGSPDNDATRKENTLVCPVLHWLDGIGSHGSEGQKTSERGALGDIVQARPFHPISRVGNQDS